MLTGPCNPDCSIDLTLENICLFIDYIFLDTDERRRFAQVSHEYLIEQVQFNGRNHFSDRETVANIELRFNHPVKELVWVAQDLSDYCDHRHGYEGYEGDDANATTCCAGNLIRFIYHSAATGLDTVEKAVLQLNGHDRFREREGTYFRVVQPYQHHTGAFDHHTPDPAAAGFDAEKEKGFFYVYSFAIRPEEHQPSGTCNFSRIDNALLTLQLQCNNAKQVRVYATNYNVLRIMSGMGGLAYSN